MTEPMKTAQLLPCLMTEPIDQPTKDLIEKEAKDYARDEHWINQDSYLGYIAGATVWAEKLKRLET